MQKRQIAKFVLGGAAYIGANFIIGAAVGTLLPPGSLPKLARPFVYMGNAGLGAAAGNAAQNAIEGVIDEVCSLGDYAGAVADELPNE